MLKSFLWKTCLRDGFYRVWREGKEIWAYWNGFHFFTRLGEQIPDKEIAFFVKRI